MARFFTSDLHFGHANVIDYCNRPYKSVQEMNEAIINEWNSKVAAEDEVIFVGDFGINVNTVLNADLVNKLNGRKHIVVGNHDFNFTKLHKHIEFESTCAKYIAAGWESISTLKTMFLKDGTHVTITHLPPCNEHDTRYGDFKIENDPSKVYLHGHLHGYYRKKRNMIDVCFDAELKILSEDEVISFIKDERDLIPTRLTEKYRTNSLFLEPFEKEVKNKYVSKNVNGNLVLYNYTDSCTYDKAWNDVTIWARGIIFDRNEGRLVAAPFKKFFNMSELQRSTTENEENTMDQDRKLLFDSIRDNVPFEVFNKEDGSLGIIYHYDGKWNVATRGSFNSDQAVKGEEILKKYDMSRVNTELTLLVEIIYPENKIVIDYKGEEKLVLLGANHRVKQVEVSRTFLEKTSEMTGMPIVESYKYSIEQMVALQKTLPKDSEGFVVRFENGLRVKIKGEEYLRIHKLISQVSPLAFWESMVDGKVRADFLKELPEEYREEADRIVKILEKKYFDIYHMALWQFGEAYPGTMLVSEDLKAVKNDLRKSLGLKQKQYTFGHMFFNILDLNRERIDKQIMTAIRPSGNVLV